MQSQVAEGNLSSTATRPRLAIVVSHPIQHFCPMYRLIAADGRVDLLVVFAVRGAAPKFDSGFGRVVDWQADILEGYAQTVVDADDATRPKAVLDVLRNFSPDVVYVHGYATNYLKATMRWAHGSGIPLLMMTDSELLHPRPWYVSALKRLFLPWIIRNVDLILTVGDENERYFEFYGIDRKRFFRNSFSIDSEYYDKILERRAEVRAALRERLGLAEDAVAILTVGKMIPRKAQADLIRAIGKLAESGSTKAVLLIAGDGELRPELEALAKPLGAAVRLLGFIGVDDLPEYYIASDVYAHPSDFDPHPLAISEALYCGLPIIASSRIGSVGATDDVQVGRNGWVYPVNDVDALTKILSDVVSQPEILERAAKESRPLGEVHAAPRCARLFVDAALLSLGRKASKGH